jgi:hypothetical protein
VPQTVGQFQEVMRRALALINSVIPRFQERCSCAQSPSGEGAKLQEGWQPRDEDAQPPNEQYSEEHRRTALRTGRSSGEDDLERGTVRRRKPLKGENPGKPRTACQANP